MGDLSFLYHAKKLTLVEDDRDTVEQSSEASESNTYYIVPPGMDVIFQDEHGKEITRYLILLYVAGMK